MRVMKFAAALGLVAIGLSGSILPTSPLLAAADHNALRDLVLADRGFSEAAAGKPIGEALGAMFASDVIMTVPGGFAKGREAALAAIAANAANAGATAAWSPIHAFVSADGTHGFTYGFQTISKAGEADRRAKYLAYWVKGAEGWRVAGYKRAPSREGAVATAYRPSPPPAEADWSGADLARAKAELAAIEKQFSDRAEAAGLAKAFAEYGRADAMNFGNGSDFVYTAEGIAAGMPGDVPSPVTWAADEGTLISPSGDLGVNFGYIRPRTVPAGQPDKISFFTIWRRDTPTSPWRYVAE